MPASSVVLANLSAVLASGIRHQAMEIPFVVWFGLCAVCFLLGVAAASYLSWPVANAANKKPQPQPPPHRPTARNWTAEEVTAAAMPPRSITPRQSMLRNRTVHEDTDGDNEEDAGDEGVHAPGERSSLLDSPESDSWEIDSPGGTRFKKVKVTSKRACVRQCLQLR